MDGETDRVEDRTNDDRDEPSPATLPLPPYPGNLGDPRLHIVRVIRDPFGFMDRAVADHDTFRTSVLGSGDIYNVVHPDQVKRILLTDRERFRKTEDFRIAFGDGLVTVEGEEWRRQRETLRPLFTHDAVVGYADGMTEQVRRRCRRWTDGDEFDLQHVFQRMTLDVLFATVLGRELELDGDERLREATEHLNDWFVPTSWFLPTWIPTPARRRFRRAKRTLEDETSRLLDEAAGDAPTDPEEADDLLSLLVGLREAGLVDGETFSDERLRDQMVTLLFAGHDTTASTLTFASWALATHPEVRARFHAEVDAIDGPPTAERLPDLPVTERVVTETLRLFPPVHTLPRQTAAELVLDGYRFPAGARVHVLLRNVHRDPRFFEDPTTFRPSRWDGDLRRSIPDFAYAPFGGGPRLCIGREFALLEAKLALATIGREYAFEWLGGPGDPPVSPAMTTRMAPGTWFRVRER